METNRQELAVVLWMNQEYGRRVLRGVQAYCDRNPCFVTAVVDKMNVPLGDRGVRSTAGAIVACEHQELPESAFCPTVRVVHAGRFAPERIAASVSVDWRQVGRLAGEYFLGLNFPHFAVAAPAEGPFAGEVAAGMDAVAESRNLGRTSVLDCAGAKLSATRYWLKHLPRPVGLVVLKDSLARPFLDLAVEAGLRVPEDVAILGVGDDDVLCMATRPPLSSIAIPAERIGFLAAQRCAELISGKKARPVRLPPTHVMTRRSTRMVAGDAVTTQALAHISNHFWEGIGAREVAEHVGCTVRSLNRHFARSMNLTVHEQIVRCRMQRAKQLLTTTHQPVKAVALAVGIHRMDHFSRFFKTHSGMSPSRFRAGVTGRPAAS